MLSRGRKARSAYPLRLPSSRVHRRFLHHSLVVGSLFSTRANRRSACNDTNIQLTNSRKTAPRPSRSAPRSPSSVKKGTTFPAPTPLLPKGPLHPLLPNPLLLPPPPATKSKKARAKTNPPPLPRPTKKTPTNPAVRPHSALLPMRVNMGPTMPVPRAKRRLLLLGTISRNSLLVLWRERLRWRRGSRWVRSRGPGLRAGSPRYVLL